MRTVKVRNTVLGEGLPKICVPITGTSEMEIKTQAEAAALAGADLVEWRADYLKPALLNEIMERTFSTIRGILGEIPLIFTVRTSREGGNREISTEDYVKLYKKAAALGQADLIDLEVETLRNDGHEPGQVIRQLQQAGALVLASNHHFEGTPSTEEIVAQLMTMDRDGADLLKEAVMPKSSGDVLALLRATEMMKALTEKPVITMSMGRLGMISRMSGEIFGSVMTFGTVGNSSAPGQIPLEELRMALKVLHGGAH
ncbi:MAG TPA: type I 3-dehydroquinate dehydratase [Candidatus Egerieimonas intestinavium]|uniref:3-dehydroquinate dehydratase n=1 Tax=Candidatus Egerieimonas intestinavium TaxID=2840777 RepID=A0A9D1JFV6_9FIRM|nr:type I 3-dehydroquinate dehydratase [Candidatus Egerieimonas intestinavium]